MEIKVLGPGCRKCKAVEEAARAALVELGIEGTVEKITDADSILDYDVLITPGLVINGKVKVFGRVPSKDEIMVWLKEEAK